MTDKTELEVTAAERLLVADILDEVSNILDHNGIGQVADLIRDGEYDEHDCVTIAARHRLATRTPDPTPVAWMYSNADDLTPNISSERWHNSEEQGWTETPLYAHPPAVPADGLVEAMQSVIAGVLEAEWSESYDCARVWSAWGYDTMGEDDFEPVINRIDQIATGIASALATHRGEA